MHTALAKKVSSTNDEGVGIVYFEGNASLSYSKTMNPSLLALFGHNMITASVKTVHSANSIILKHIYQEWNE